MALLVGKKAPHFKAPAVVKGTQMVNTFSLQQFLHKKEVVLFFYPKDFTYVCPTELLKLQEMLGAFQERNVEVVAISTDTRESHYAWLNTPRDKGGIKGVTYTLVADNSKTIATNFGVLAGVWKVSEQNVLSFEGDPVAYRGTFFIDKKGIVRHQSINDFSLGRNIYEILRLVDMFHHTQEHGNVCPVNWTKGDRDVVPTPEGIEKYLSETNRTGCKNHNGERACKCKCC